MFFCIAPQRIASLLALIGLLGCQTTNPEEPSPEEAQQAQVSRTVQSVAVSLLNKGKPDLALKELRPYHVSHPDDEGIINVMGLCHLALGQPRRAEELFARSYRLKKDTAVALNLSSTYLEQKQWPRAVSLLKNLTRKGTLARYPHPERVYHNLASAYDGQGKTELSRRTFDKALTYHSSYLPSLMAKARLNMRVGRHAAESWRLIGRAEKACPRCFQPVLLKALWADRYRGRKQAVRIIDAFAASSMATPKSQRMAKRLKKKLQAMPPQQPRSVATSKSLPKAQKKE